MRILVTGLARIEQTEGGSQRYLSGLADALADGGHVVRIITGADLVDTRDTASASPAARLLRTLVRLVVGIPRGALSVARFRPDVVTVHFPLDGLGAALGARWAGRPTVIHFHGPWAREAAAAGRGWFPFIGRQRIEAAIYHLATSWITQSSAFADLLASDYDIDRKLIRVIPGGRDLPEVVQPSPAECRRRLGLRERFTLVTVRRLVPRTGVDLSILTLAEIVRRRPHLDAQLIVAGDGPELEALRALARSENVEDRVMFTGRFPDELLWTVYGAGDICLVTSRALEGFGYGALEGLASGRPTVVTAIGGLPEVVAPLEPRWVVPAEPNEIASTVLFVADDPSRFPDANACRAYAAGFAWPQFVGRILDVYTEAVVSSRRGRRRSRRQAG